MPAHFCHLIFQLQVVWKSMFNVAHLDFSSTEKTDDHRILKVVEFNHYDENSDLKCQLLRLLIIRSAKKKIYIHCSRAIYTPRFVCIFFTYFLKIKKNAFSRRFFQKILPLFMVSVQEWFVIKIWLWWRAFSIPDLI